MNFGPRFFLSEKYQENNLLIYKSKEELLKINNDFNKEQCVICLLNLFNENKNLELANNNNNNVFNDYDINNINNINNSNKLDFSCEDKENNFNKTQEIKNENLKNSENLSVLETIVKSDFKMNTKKEKHKKIIKNIKKICKNVWNVIKFIITKLLFKFYRKKHYNSKKLFIYTQCHHVFHRDCLEMWLERKKICPNCRNSLKD